MRFRPLTETNRAPLWGFSVLVFYRLVAFGFRCCTVVGVLHLELPPPLPSVTVRTFCPVLLLAPGLRRYSSVREREIRGPFLISFLFSSFLLLFSSSLRIFWNASAVCSTWGLRRGGGLKGNRSEDQALFKNSRNWGGWQGCNGIILPVSWW